MDKNRDMKRRLMLSVSAFAFSVAMLSTGVQAAHTGNAELTDIMNIAGNAYSSQLSQNKEIENGDESAEYEEYKKKLQEEIFRLVGSRYSQIFGMAANFAVFVEDNFEPDGSYCEGRIAVGGNFINRAIGTDYLAGKFAEKTGTLSGIIAGKAIGLDTSSPDRLYVVGGGTFNSNSGENKDIYSNVSDYIDFEDEFLYLRASATLLAELGPMDEDGYPASSPYINNGWSLEFVGEDPSLNVFTVSVSEFNEYVQYAGLVFTVPKNSAVILNIYGTEDLDLSPSFIRYAGKQIDRTNKEAAGNILINILDAENVTTNGVKATILAPNSNIKAVANHHQEGQVVAHSLKGDLKIGTALFSLDASRTIESAISGRGAVKKQNSDPWLDRVNAFLGIAPEPSPEPSPEPVVKEEAPAKAAAIPAEPKDYNGMFEALMAALSSAAVLGFASNGHSRKVFTHFA